MLVGATNFINNKGKIVSQSKVAIYQPIRVNLAKLMKTKYSVKINWDNWFIKKICRKNKISQKIPIETFLSEDFAEKNEARDLLTTARLEPEDWTVPKWTSTFRLPDRQVFLIRGSLTKGLFIRLRTVKIFYFFFGCLTFLFIPAKLFEWVEDWSYLGFILTHLIGQRNVILIG